ncbi:MAG: multidrug efflux pump subunit AcrB [Verrucomicrobiales bacterium]|jgi:multidrug efflux pump subunit AcrB
MIAWFAKNGVAANLLMVVLLVLGIRSAFFVMPIEGFPEFDSDEISVSVSYRGATPAETEEGVVLKIEEAIKDLEGIEEIESRASEGSGTVNIEVEAGYDPREVLDDVKNRIDSINTFPVETEKPVIRLSERVRPVISLVVSGQLEEAALHRLGEQIRDEVLSSPEVTQAELKGVRAYEISIEVSENTLQKYGFTLSQISDAIRKSSVDMPAGGIKTSAGEVLVRTKGRAYVREDFERIVLRTNADGSRITIADIATVNDGFEEDPVFAQFDGKPAVTVQVSRVGNQSALKISQFIKDYIDEAQARMPEGVALTYWQDSARRVEGRLSTLKSSALIGGVIVFLLLTLFLRIGVATWVTLGIPIAFAGAFSVLPLLGVTVNIISLFAFILMLGIVVDDAIVTGENIYSHLKQGKSGTQAAIDGTNEVFVPVTFGVITTIVAFVPILFLPGFRGKIFAIIPAVVLPILVFSLIESKLILPAHLKHLKVGNRKREELGFFSRLQRRVADTLELVAEKVYAPALEFCLRNRYLTVSLFVAAFMIVFTLITTSRVGLTFFPRIPQEQVTASLRMLPGNPVEDTELQVARIRAAAEQLQQKYIDPTTGESIIKHIFTTVGSTSLRSNSGGSSSAGQVEFELTPADSRGIDVPVFPLVAEWRKTIGPIAGVKELNFRAEFGRGGEPVDIRLRGQDVEALGQISNQIQAFLADYDGVFDIRDNLEDGKEEIRLKIKPSAEQYNLTMNDLGQQAREAFFGAEAQRIQRGREDIRVMVRYPKAERESLDTLQNMRIRTPDGAGVPFSEVAEVEYGRAPTSIERFDRNRTVAVQADIRKDVVKMPLLNAALTKKIDEILLDYPAVYYSLEGETREQRESSLSLLWGVALSLFAMYALLAIPFGSYTQPFIVLVIIPFTLIGAVVGHIVMGLPLSFMSVFGMLALAGVGVNDSLVLVDFINRKQRKEGLSLNEAIRAAGKRRFRPIILTSLTTSLGLLPLILERSTQAQFLIPMAVSLGFGILFATFVTLLLVPVNYLILNDLKTAFRRYWKWQTTWSKEPSSIK